MGSPATSTRQHEHGEQLRAIPARYSLFSNRFLRLATGYAIVAPSQALDFGKRIFWGSLQSPRAVSTMPPGAAALYTGNGRWPLFRIHELYLGRNSSTGGSKWRGASASAHEQSFSLSMRSVRVDCWSGSGGRKHRLCVVRFDPILDSARAPAARP